MKSQPDRVRNRREVLFIITSIASIPTAISIIARFTSKTELQLIGTIGNIVIGYNAILRKALNNIQKIIGLDIYIPIDTFFLGISLTFIYISTFITKRYFIDTPGIHDVEDDNLWVYFSAVITIALIGSFSDKETVPLFIFLFITVGIAEFLSQSIAAWRRDKDTFRSFISFALIPILSVILIIIFVRTAYLLTFHEYSIRDIWVAVPVYSFLICALIIRQNVRALPAIILAVGGLFLADLISVVPDLLETWLL